MDDIGERLISHAWEHRQHRKYREAAAREITRLRAQVEALRADAERYRWLRDEAAYVTQFQFASVIANDQWDTRIDAARAAQGGE